MTDDERWSPPLGQVDPQHPECAAVIAEVWASGNLVNDTDQWIHFYVEAVTDILRQNIGDWGDGIFFSGIYDVQFQPPKSGGVGFVQSAKVSCNLNVSRN